MDKMNRRLRRHQLCASMEAWELTFGASVPVRIIPVFRNLRQSVFSHRVVLRCFLFIKSLFVWMLLLLLPHHHRDSAPPPYPVSNFASETFVNKKTRFRKNEEDTLRRRSLVEALLMVSKAMTKEIDVIGSWDENSSSRCRWSTSLFFGVRYNALFAGPGFRISEN